MVLLTCRFGCARGLAAITLLVATTLVQAQGAPARAPRADPLDAQARVPAVTYRSPLASYRRLGDDKPVPWKEANDTVTRIGGWRTYTRQAQQPDVPASAPVATPAPGDQPHKH